MGKNMLSGLQGNLSNISVFILDAIIGGAEYPANSGNPSEIIRMAGGTV